MGNISEICNTYTSMYTIVAAGVHFGCIFAMELNGVGANGVGGNPRCPKLIDLKFTNPINTNPVKGRQSGPKEVGVSGVGELEPNLFWKS